MAPLPDLDVDDFDHGDFVEEKELPLQEGMEEMKQPNRQ